MVKLYLFFEIYIILMLRFNLISSNNYIKLIHVVMGYRTLITSLTDNKRDIFIPNNQTTLSPLR